MKPKKVFGNCLLFVFAITGIFLLTFLLLSVAPTHPGNEEHKAIMQFLLPIAKSDVGFLTVDEYDHMLDVKAWVYVSLAFFAISFFALKKYKWKLTPRYAGYTLLLIVAFFAGMALKGFSSAWVKFHHIFFPQGGWQFASNSTLITLYPESYFFGAALLFFGLVLVVASDLIGTFKLGKLLE